MLNVNGDAEPCESLFEWAEWFERSRDTRTLRRDTIGDVLISTVFLALDHAFGGMVPVLWETMIFGGPHDAYQERYTSKDAALAGHARAVALVRDGVNEPGCGDGC